MKANQWRDFFLLFLILWALVSDAYHGAVNPESAIRGIDFKAYYVAAERLNAGEKLYWPEETGERSGYLYSPPLAIALRPLAKVPFDQALKIWTLFSVVSLLAAIGCYARVAGFSAREVVPLGVILFTGFRIWPSTLDFGLGQADFTLLALVCAMILAGERGHFRTAAFCIAAAATLKLWMAGAGIYLLLRRKWGAAVWCIGFFLLLNAIGFSIVGWHELPRFLETIRLNAQQESLVSQSILGFIRLHFTTNTHIVPLTANPLIFRTVAAAGILTVLAALTFIYRLGKPRTTHDALLQAGFAMHSLVLLLPLCHAGYFLLSLPLLWTLLVPRNFRQTRAAVIASAFVIYVTFTRSWPVAGAIVKDYATGYRTWLISGYFLSAAALWFLGLYEIRRRAREPQLGMDGTALPTALLTEDAI